MSRHSSGGLGGRGSKISLGSGRKPSPWSGSIFMKAYAKAPHEKPNDIIMKWSRKDHDHYELPTDLHLKSKSYGELTVAEIQKVMEELSKSTFFYKTGFTQNVYLSWICCYPLIPVPFLFILGLFWSVFMFIMLCYLIPVVVLAILSGICLKCVWESKARHRGEVITKKLAEISARPKFSPRIVWSCDALATYVRIEFKFVDEQGNLRKVQEPLSLVIDKSQENLLGNKGPQKRMRLIR